MPFLQPIGAGLLRGAAVIWVNLTLVFIVLRVLPGDAVQIALAQTGADRQQIEAQRHALCLDCPLHKQYLAYLGDMAQGDLGFSLHYQQPVATLIIDRLWPTVSLGLAALGVALWWGAGLGVANGLGGPRLQAVTSALIVYTQAIPIYVTAVMGIVIFSLYLDILPAVGADTPRHLLLPAGVLGIHTGGTLARVLGASLRATRAEAFILTAQAKGLPPLDQLDHLWRLAILPVLNVIALQAGFLLSGTVILEYIFVRRGLGSLLYDAVLFRDYPTVQAIVLLSVLIYLVANALAQLTQYMIDPRLRDKPI
jgi:ABC-type dipeptide/oligopeptide/nickel transport system permease component